MGFPGSSAGKESACSARDSSSIPGSGRSAEEGISCPLQFSWALLVAQLVKNLPAMWKAWINPWAGKIPWRRKQLPTPVSWPGEFYGLYSPWGCKELDRTEQLSLFTVQCVLFYAASFTQYDFLRIHQVVVYTQNVLRRQISC